MDDLEPRRARPRRLGVSYNVRFDGDEFQHISRRAQQLGLTVSQFLRRSAIHAANDTTSTGTSTTVRVSAL